MYEKIKAQLKVKYPGVSDKALDSIAKRLAKKVTEESAIEGAITEFDTVVGVQDYAGELQAEGDRRVTEAQKKPKVENPNPQPQPNTPAPADDVPVWAKGLIDTVNGLKSEKQKETIQEKINKLLTDKKIPLVMGKGRMVEKEEDIEALVGEIEADYSTIRQDNVNETVDKNKVTVIGGSQKAETIDADIANWSKGQQKEPAKQS